MGVFCDAGCGILRGSSYGSRLSCSCGGVVGSIFLRYFSLALKSNHSFILRAYTNSCIPCTYEEVAINIEIGLRI